MLSASQGRASPTPPRGPQGTGLTAGKWNALRLATTVPGVCVLSRSSCSSFLVLVCSQNPTRRRESPAWLPPPVHGSLFYDSVLETTGLGAITQMCLPHRRSVNFHFSLLGDSPSPPVGCLLLGPGKGRGKWCFSRQRPSQQRSLINSPGAPCPCVCPGARSQPCPQSLEVKEGSVRTPRGVLRPSPRHTRFLAGVRPAGTS